MLYILLKSLHILGVALFLGGLTVNWVLRHGLKKENKAWLYSAIRTNDKTVTSMGMGLILVSGAAMAGILGKAAAKPWFFIAFSTALVTVGLWMVGLVSVQKHQDVAWNDQDGLADEEERALNSKWFRFWWLTFISAVFTLVVMVGKEHLI